MWILNIAFLYASCFHVKKLFKPKLVLDSDCYSGVTGKSLYLQHLEWLLHE